jgi:hypothetical protein
MMDAADTPQHYKKENLTCWRVSLEVGTALSIMAIGDREREREREREQERGDRSVIEMYCFYSRGNFTNTNIQNKRWLHSYYYLFLTAGVIYQNRRLVWKRHRMEAFTHIL